MSGGGNNGMTMQRGGFRQGDGSDFGSRGPANGPPINPGGNLYSSGPGSDYQSGLANWNRIYGQPPQGYGGGQYGGGYGGLPPSLEGGGGMRNVPFTGGGGDQFQDPRYANPVSGGGGVSFTPGERTGMPSIQPQGRNAFAGSMLYGGGQPGGVSFTPPERPGMQAMPGQPGRGAFAGSMLYGGGQPGGGGNFQQPPGGMNKPGVGPSPSPQSPPPFAGNPYAPGYQPGAGWDIMQREYAQQRQNQMGQQAPFGRYADGTPMADPSINFRANANRGRYGGGWGT